MKVLEALREHGFGLSIDDYGTGQSTLSYVKTLPVNELKIDKTFVTLCAKMTAIGSWCARPSISRTSSGLTVVAEGVEDWDTVSLLTELGCDYAQGSRSAEACRSTDFSLDGTIRRPNKAA